MIDYVKYAFFPIFGLFFYSSVSSQNINDPNKNIINYRDISKKNIIINGKLGLELGKLIVIKCVFKYNNDSLFVTHVDGKSLDKEIFFEKRYIVPYSFGNDCGEPYLLSPEQKKDLGTDWDFVYRLGLNKTGESMVLPKSSKGDQWEIVGFESLKCEFVPELPFGSFLYHNDGDKKDSNKNNNENFKRLLRFYSCVNVIGIKVLN